ncbi:DUF4307 domain-containing protein [Actinokineospora globicatena]|uniref:DUF4307 domain-containing protein n=1 Tax=Actinokineospora globicatena TaxID=103729 RepID=A0A9W6QQ63_9PSEU|nr:DUF4307 domain-containing protein [Actinokineospora globicatena]MCP2300563.1 protein of unknown function (DUF4307) [Actinokineospora globicatena]GLW81107.1 hypothetical protein Aglo01_55880 [Actinokineospora globicatena]GLW88300.1 hypothetical protein Aglo02_59390 [Actinokineospora globicatena]GLW92770.1 hypothetical protein Aglo03_35860 [Actinokineospora globicatena]
MTAAGRTPPEGRYGARKAPRSKRTAVVLVVLGLAAGIVVAFLGYQNLGTAPIEAERTAFNGEPGNRMRMTFDVTRTTPERAAVCVVRVRGIDGSETGRKEVYIAPGQDSVRMTTTIASSGEPVTADVFGCSYQVPAYLSTAQPPTG